MKQTAQYDDLTLFLCGDVMTGRGIDQILPHPGDPVLKEPYMESALGYVELARRSSGSIPISVAPDYVWGNALQELARVRPLVHLVNLETAVTSSNDAWPGKGIHYRMHPDNIACLVSGRIDCCVLANNHVMDWGRAGLAETLVSLHAAGIKTAGAGLDEAQACAPAVIELPGERRLLVFACATESSGVPREWSADHDRSGVCLLPDFSAASSEQLAHRIHAIKRPGDVVVVSVHWGGNWGYQILPEERSFAHRLVEQAGVDILHGHSSHHPKGIEVHAGRLILYGCGDFLNDYEGIGGYEEFRPELSLMYFPTLDGHGQLVRLEIVPLRVRRMRLERVRGADLAWMKELLGREGRALGTRIEQDEHQNLMVRCVPCGVA